MTGVGKQPVFGPGGGGGGGTQGFAGGSGFAGQIELTYTPPGAPAYNITRFLLHVPSADTDGAVLMRVASTGTIDQLDLVYNTASSGELTLKGYSLSVLQFTSAAITGINGNSYMVSMELGPGSNVAYTLRTLKVNGATTSSTTTGTATAGGSMGSVTNWTVNALASPSASVSAIGSVVIQYAFEDPSVVYNAIIGYAGESGGARFQRLCNEQNIPFEFTGNVSDTPLMGPQPDAKFMDVLQDIEDMDQGLLLESMDQFGMQYRTYKSLTNQTPFVIVDYSQGQLSPPFQPTQDDQLTRNVVTITRKNGSSVTVRQSTGPLSTQDPPNGVGEYTYALTVNAYQDNSLLGVANKILALGTVDDLRYPVVSFQLSRSAAQSIFGSLMKHDEGAYMQIMVPPSFLTSDSSINQLVLGYTFELAAFQLDLRVNCIPESPFEV